MAKSIVHIQTQLTDAELVQFVTMLADFFKKNKEEAKRARKYFPSMKTNAEYLKTVLYEGATEIEAWCDFEEENERLRELDEMHEADIFVYGDEHGHSADGDSE